MIHPVYMLLGPEKGQKKTFIANLKKDLKDYQVSKFYGFEDYQDEFYAQLVNKDLFSPHSLVIMENVEEIKSKEKIKPLVSYIKAPSENVTLVLVSDAHFVSSELMAVMPNQNQTVLKFFEMFENQKEQWIRTYFKDKGFGIDSDAVRMIIERVENNQSEFENVCSQLIAYFNIGEKNKVITSEDIDKYLIHSRGESVSSLFSCIAYGKLESALECVNVLCSSSDAWQISSLLSTLSFSFKRLYSVQKIMEQGVKNADEALKEKYFDSDRPVTSFKEKNIYKAAMNLFTIEDVKNTLILLAEYDIRVKEGGPMLQQLLIERCIVKILKKKNKI